MPVLDCILLQDSDDGKQSLEVFNGSLELFVRLPFLQILRKSDTLISVFLSSLLHSIDLLDVDLTPEHLLEGVDLLDDLRVQVVKLLEVGQLSLGFFEGWVFLVLQAEELLSFVVDFELMLSDLVLLVESL